MVTCVAFGLRGSRFFRRPLGSRVDKFRLLWSFSRSRRVNLACPSVWSSDRFFKNQGAQEARGALYGEANFGLCGHRSLRASNLSMRYFIPINRLFFPGYLWWLSNESGLG